MANDIDADVCRELAQAILNFLNSRAELNSWEQNCISLALWGLQLNGGSVDGIGLYLTRMQLAYACEEHAKDHAAAEGKIPKDVLLKQAREFL
ncbi:hypothetical protein OL229_04975 [Neisseriaceae bacterium JH1-16]|nr:hypothetical protein [Neisseriaceae bacterium JH1-16]